MGLLFGFESFAQIGLECGSMAIGIGQQKRNTDFVGGFSRELLDFPFLFHDESHRY